MRIREFCIWLYQQEIIPNIEKRLNNLNRVVSDARKGMKIHDIVFDVACGRRNYTEEVERYFKLNPPGSKSTKYNLIIKNSGIQDEDLQYALGQRIYNIINNTAPAYTKLNTIKWIG
jgi:hypothetical protein